MICHFIRLYLVPLPAYLERFVEIIFFLYLMRKYIFCNLLRFNPINMSGSDNIIVTFSKWSKLSCRALNCVRFLYISRARVIFVWQPFHTVSFDWFLSGLEWIIYLDFWYFTRNYYGISDLGLTLPHFGFLGLYLDMFDQNWSSVDKNWRFW